MTTELDVPAAGPALRGGRTRGKQAHLFARTIARGGFYESRWGVLNVPVLVEPGFAAGRFSAAVVDPTLPAADRARLTRPLRFARHAYPTGAIPLAGGFVAAVLALMVAGRFPSVGMIPMVVAVSGLVVWLAALLALRWAARLPEDLRDRVVVGAARATIAHDDHGLFKGTTVKMTCTHPVVTAAGDLGRIETTSGTTDADVDDLWQTLWQHLRDRAAWEAEPTP